MDLPTYTNIWRIEKRLYKLYDLRLPMPLPLGQIVAFAGITIPYVLILTLIGIPFNHNLFWLYVLPPGVLTWLATRPVLENKKLPELLVSQVRYLGEPGVWCRMAPSAEKDEIAVVGRVWHSSRQPAPQLQPALEAVEERPAIASTPYVEGEPEWAPPAQEKQRRHAEPRHRKAAASSRPAATAAAQGRAPQGQTATARRRPRVRGTAAAGGRPAPVQRGAGSGDPQRRPVLSPADRGQPPGWATFAPPGDVPVRPAASSRPPAIEVAHAENGRKTSRPPRPAKPPVLPGGRGPAAGPSQAGRQSGGRRPVLPVGRGPSGGVQAGPSPVSGDQRPPWPVSHGPSPAPEAGSRPGNGSRPPVLPVGRGPSAGQPPAGLRSGSGSKRPAPPIGRGSSAGPSRAGSRPGRGGTWPALPGEGRPTGSSGAGSRPGRDAIWPELPGGGPSAGSSRAGSSGTGSSRAGWSRAGSRPDSGGPWPSGGALGDGSRVGSRPGSGGPRPADGPLGDGSRAGSRRPSDGKPPAWPGGPPAVPSQSGPRPTTQGNPPTRHDRGASAWPMVGGLPPGMTITPPALRPTGNGDPVPSGPGGPHTPSALRPAGNGDPVPSGPGGPHTPVQDAPAGLTSPESRPVHPEQAGAPTPPGPVPPGPAAPKRPVVKMTHGPGQEKPARTIERALSGRPGPRGRSWSDRVRLVPGGQGAGRAGETEQEKRDKARARLPLPGPRRVVVLGCTSGAGQTVTALMAARLLAELRSERVAALDLNPGSASLARRARVSPAGTVPDLLAGTMPVNGVHRAGVEVIAPADGQASVKGLDEGEFGRIGDRLAERYGISLVDPGASAVARALAIADQLVLVAPASADAPRAVSMTQEWLAAHDPGGLAASAIMVVNGVSGRSMPHVEQAEAIAAGRCRAIVRVPWEDDLGADGGPCAGAGPLRLPARQALTALAGLIVSGLAGEAGEQR